ncbi:hypothetical protein VTG60DRAFT_668 [Thermothelomyces hinnuleus]
MDILRFVVEKLNAFVDAIAWILIGVQRRGGGGGKRAKPSPTSYRKSLPNLEARNRYGETSLHKALWDDYSSAWNVGRF